MGGRLRGDEREREEGRDVGEGTRGRKEGMQKRGKKGKKVGVESVRFFFP